MNIIATLLAGFIGFFIAKQLKFPAPAMIGSMIAVGVFNVLFDIAYMPTVIKIFTQGIAGVFIGIQMKLNDLKNIKKLAKPILLLILMFTINTFVVGILITKLCGLDLTTALLSCVAGGVTDISLISMDMGADTSVVALMQTSRLISALLVFPMWISFFLKRAKIKDFENEVVIEDRHKAKSFKKNLGKMILSITIAFLASYVGSLIKIPAGPLVLSMLTIMILNNTTKLIYVEKNIKMVGQLFAGSLVGATMTRETFMSIPSLLTPILILLFSYWIINILYGKICQDNKLLDIKSALFASSPAGASDMALIAADMGADLAKIGLIQVIRLIYAVSVMPQLINLFLIMFI